ncbi:hypothetical protein A2U01_0005580 [Trifolium medium]|uniref:Uncharacterized protein n=1 Tax=Trifolium medium TaxID=97028 RepID=A0A392MCB5_9FABA|nr:hypothetical protein [Trifolium medium]
MPSSEEAISRVPAPLIEEARSVFQLPNKPLPRNPFDALHDLFRINNSIVEDPLIPSPPN